MGRILAHHSCCFPLLQFFLFFFSYALSSVSHAAYIAYALTDFLTDMQINSEEEEKNIFVPDASLFLSLRAIFDRL